jgi:acetylornithine deacetylase
MEPGPADEAPSGAYGGSRLSQTGLEPPPQFAHDGLGALVPMSGPAELDPLGRDIIDAIAAEAGAMESLVTDLVRTPTTRGNEASGQEVMRDAFGELGLHQVDVRMDPDMLRAHPGHSPFSWDVSDKANVVATWRPGDAPGPPGRSLILNGHIDVVSAEPLDRWSVPPFAGVREGNWLYGRGAADMKCGLAAVVGAVRGLRSLGLVPRAPVILESVVEEECTGNGTLQCVLAGFAADGAIVAEPFGAAITTSQVGVLWFDVHVPGVSGHAAEEAMRVNAIERSFVITRALRGLEDELNADPPSPYDRFAHPISLNVGVIRGGDWPSTVPGECVTSYRIAQYPGEPLRTVQDRIEAVVADAAARQDGAAPLAPRVRYEGFRSEGYALSEDSPLVETLTAAFARQSGASPALVATTGVTDAGILGLYGNTPAVCFGPYAEQAHGVDERVYLPSVVQTAQVMGLFVRDWCGLDR